MTGLVGSLGYWLEQQPVQRGGQPWFYYAFVQIPVYEYLPAIGVLRRLVLARGALFRRMRRTGPTGGSAGGVRIAAASRCTSSLGIGCYPPVVAYSYAGEKMPWLTMHIALPMILLAGWAFGRR